MEEAWGKDSFDLRHGSGMETAVLEWFMLGDADYCLSPSAEHSTFSKTAIARGKCVYLNFRSGEECMAETEDGALTQLGKEHLLTTRVHNHPYLRVPKVNSNRVFDSIRM